MQDPGMQLQALWAWRVNGAENREGGFRRVDEAGKQGTERYNPQTQRLNLYNAS